MPECDVCGGDQFFEEDGQYFCTVCNTQSQSMVVMQTEEDPYQSQRQFRSLREVGKTAARSDQENKDSASSELGRPWTKYEAYQLILQAQADAMISHGADPFIRDAILRLYFKYLSVLGVAFTEGLSQLVPEGLQRVKGLWHRELHHGGMESPIVKAKGVQHTLRRKSRVNSGSKAKLRKLEQKQENEGLSQRLQGEEFYEGDNPAADSGNDNDSSKDFSVDASSSDSNSDDTSGESDDNGDNDFGFSIKEFEAGAISSTPKRVRPPTEKKLKSFTIRKFSAKHMNLSKTLVFCYLGSLFTENSITFADILRWVCDGSLPYLETTQHLHKDMKLSAYDHYMFLPKPVTSEELYLNTAKIAKFIGMDRLPALPFKPVLAKFVTTLDLPEEVQSLAVQLMTKYSVGIFPSDGSVKISPSDGRRTKAIPNIDAISAAYILVTLKLVFGINDRKERFLEEYTRALQNKLSADVRLFDWEVWQNHLSSKFLSDDGSSTFGYLGISSISDLCKAFRVAHLTEKRYSLLQLYPRQKKTKVASYDQENRELLNRPIKTLLDRLKNRAAIDQRKRDNMGHSVSSTQMLSSALSSAEDSENSLSFSFRKTTVQHITQWQQFLHSNLHLSESLCSEHKSVFILREGSDTEYSGSDDPLKSILPAEKTSGQKKEKFTMLSQEDCRLIEALSCKKESCRIAADLLNLKLKAGERYDLHPRLTFRQLNKNKLLQEARSRQSHSYKWLLKLLHRVTFCAETHIEQKVWDIEDAIRAKMGLGTEVSL